MSRIPETARNGDIVELHTYTVGTVPVQIAQSRPARRAIVLSASGTESVTVGLSPAVVAAGGLQIVNTVGPVRFERGQYAPLVVSPLWAVAAAPGGTVSVIEVVDSHVP